MPSWEEMCQQIVVAGRPGDVATAASLWEQLLKNVNAVKESLETNVKDLGEVWKGEAYEAFKTHITGIAKEAEGLVKDAEGQNGIVQSLRTAADDLSAAQARFPIPASCVNDVLEARNGRLVIDTGLFEMKVKPDFMGLLDPLTSLYDWINDKSEEAAQVYGDVSGQYLTTDQGMPGTVGPGIDRQPTPQTPDLGGGPGGSMPGGAPGMGGMPSTGNLPGGGPSTKLDQLPGTGSMPGTGSGAHPDLGGYTPGTGYPGTGSLADDYGSGLAGAAPTTTAPGLGGGLPGTSGLGASGGGAGLAGGGGMIPGGGSLGRPVTPGMAPMMGGGMAGAGRGGGRGAGGRLGAGGKLGAGGMGPMMGGGMAGAGRGAGGRGAGRGAAGVGGAGMGAAGRGTSAAGARGGAVAGMGGTGGAGYGEEEVPRNTWLEEDEDVWGADGDGAPGVLR